MFQSELINSLQRNADRIAIEYKGQKISYASLFDDANQVTRFLGTQDLARETIVGIALSDKSALIASMIGLINARCVFVLLDRNLPVNRLNAMLEDLDLQYLITDSPSALPFAGQVANIWEFASLLQSPADAASLHYPLCDPEDSLYLYFTSGSTGKPKGIIGKNSSLLQFLQWEIKTFGLKAQTRVSQFISPFFDAFLRDIFAPLLVGGTICIPPEEEAFFSAEKLIPWIDEADIHLIHCVPSLFQVINDASLTSARFPSLQYILMSGERIVPSSLKNWYEVFQDRIQLMNLYGLTETTMIRSAYAIRPEDVNKKRIPIGNPIDDTEFLIAKKDFKPCTTLVPGDLYILSDYVSKGYLNQPELTQEKFIRIPGYEMMAVKTGDKARRLPDGTIELLGREDRQVKLNGIRIELEEIESVLAQATQTREQFVMIHQDAQENETLLAFITHQDDGAEAEQLKETLLQALRQQLPAYMIPGDIVVLQRFPLLPNGKLDQKKLVQALPTQKEIRLPQNELEALLLDIWKDILKNETLSTDDVFYQVGGTSLSMIRLIGKINKAFQVKIKINELFKNPTIIQQAIFIANAKQDTTAVISPAPAAVDYALSPTQRQLYFIQEFDPQTLAYNLPQIYVLEGEWDLDLLSATIQTLVARHESFRTCFELVGEEPRQKVLPETPLEIEHYRSSDKEAPAVFQTFIRPFDLSKAPLLRVGLNQVAPEKAVLMIDMHHIVSDAISEGVFIRELVELFNGRDLPLLAIQPKDHAEWLASATQQKIVATQRTFWKDQFLEEPKLLELPTDFYRPAIKDYRGNKVRFELDQARKAELQKICDQEGVTLYILLLSIFNVLLGKMANQEDITVGTAISGRKHVDLENLIGLFVNIIPLRNYPQPELSFRHFLSRVKTNTIACFDHQDYPFEAIIKDLKIVRSPDRNPLFEVMFEFISSGGASLEIPGLRISPFKGEENAVSRFDLTLLVREKESGLGLEFEYATSLFRQEAIERLVRYFDKTVQAVVDNPDTPISQIELLSDAEKQALLVDFNKTQQAFPEDQTFIQLFQQQLAQTPDRIAVSHQNQELTYQDLADKATRLAGYLQSKGIGRNDRVVLCMPRGIEMLTSILAVFQAGAAYLPIDVSYPQARIREIIVDSEPGIILSTPMEVAELDEICQQASITTERLAVDLEQLSTAPNTFKAVEYDVHDLAYIIYTSGSTGKPKGVMVHQKGMVNHLYAKINDLGLEPSDVVGQTASPGFDISVWQFLVGLLIGGKTHIIDKEVILSPDRLVTALVEGCVSIFESVPSLLTVFLDSLEVSQQTALQGLKWMIATGEPLGTTLVRKWYAQFPEIPLLNAYGPTEASDDITHHVVQVQDQQGVIPVGKPIQNTQIYILDKHLNLCPIGVTGEICVSGVGVGLGYWKNEQKTKEAFIANPFSVPGTNGRYQRIYKTGDLGYFRADGTVICLGRIDEQVKIQGNRIELGEIEDRLSKHPDMQEVAVLANTSQGSSAYLVAYFTASQELEALSLRDFLAESLPAYMVPTYFERLDQFPLTPNGKLDRKALPEPETKAEAVYYAPQNTQEKLLAEVWAQVLGVPAVGVTDNFFSLGGDSIKSIQISSRLRKAGYELSIQDLFSAQTISRLAPRLKELTYTVDQAPVTGAVGLTGIQQEFFQGPIQHKHHYNQSVMLHFPAGISAETVGTIFRQLQGHHDALRMVFRKQNGNFNQYNQGLDFPLSLTEWDLRQATEETSLTAYADQLQASLDLEAGPLTKLGLFHQHDGSRLLIVVHHLVMDGVSWRILFEDFETLYGQLQNKEPLKLALKTTSYQDWSRQLQVYMQGGTYAEAQHYWSNLRGNATKGLLQADFPEGENSLSARGVVSFQLDVRLSEKLLREVHSAFHTQINDLLLAALVLAIYKQYEQTDILLTLETHGREEIAREVNVSRTVGWFTNIYPVLLSRSSPDLGQLIKEVKEQLRSVPNNGLDYLLYRRLSGNADTQELRPQIIFNYLGQFDADLQNKSFFIAAESTGATLNPTESLESEWDLSGMINQGQLEMSLKYSTERYSTTTIEAVMARCQESLEELIAYCSDNAQSRFTPSDLTYKELSISQLDELQDRFEIADLYPLSPMQEGMLFHSLMDAEADHYFEQFGLELKGTLHLEAVQTAMQQLMKRYPVLRTSFLNEGYKRPLQVVLQDRPADFQYYDLRTLSLNGSKDAVRQTYYEKDRARKFDLEHDALIRLTILQTGAETYDMIWSFHHILMDGWCLRILFNDFKALYQQQRQGKAANLAEAPRYAHYIDWLEKRSKKASANYWADYLDGFAELTTLPTKPWTSALEKPYTKTDHILVLNPEQTRSLQRLSQEYKVTINTILQTAWGILLSQYNDTQDVVFGTVVSGRPPEIEGIETMVGLFINTVPVRIRTQAEQTIGELLQHTQASALESEVHHYHPLSEIQAQSELGRGLLDHLMIFENYPINEELGKTKGRREDFELTGVNVFERTNYDLSVEIFPDHAFEIWFKYNAEAFEKGTIEKVATHLHHIIAQIIADPTQSLATIDLLSETEKTQIVRDFNDTRCDYPHDKTLMELFEQQVQATPDNIAIRFGEVALTYQQLNERADQIASCLRAEFGVRKGDLIGIMLEREAWLIPSIYGILKAGAAYVPMSPSYPADRKKALIADAGLKALISRAAHLDAVEAGQAQKVDLDQWEDKILTQPISTGDVRPNSMDLAYVIYTSGSTGKPKGVMVAHHSVINRILWMQKTHPLTEVDVMVLKTPIFFDVSVSELFWWACTGASLRLLKPGQEKDPREIVKVIQEDQVTSIHFVPSMLTAFLSVVNARFDFAQLQSLRQVFTSGEALKVEQVEKFGRYIHQHCGTRLVNLYGPTEATVEVSHYECDFDALDRPIPIGKPIDNIQLYVLHQNGQLCPVGVKGELAIAGVGLAQGYLGNESLTAEKFVENPFLGGERVYLTGDLARWKPDGNIEFLGRRDNQVKIRGYRIELGEIQYQLAQYDTIEETAVLVRDREGDQYLVAYFTASAKPEAAELSAYLSALLPAYMVPPHFVQMEQFPINANGKLDRKALPDPELSFEEDSVAPATETEKALVEIWAGILRITPDLIGTNRSFFELGGHSLSAISLANRVLEKFEVEISMKNVFDLQNVQKLAALIDRSEKSEFVSIPKAEDKPYYPLTIAQRPVFFLNQIDPDSTANNIFTIVSFEGAVDRDKLQIVLQTLVDRHESLRTSFRMIDGEPAQIIEPSLDFQMEYCKAQPEEIESILDAFIRPFDLRMAPLFRAILIELGPNQFYFAADTHHIMSDGQSNVILGDDFVALLRDEALPPLAYQYRDLAEWQQTHHYQQKLEKQKAFWVNEFKQEITTLELPVDFDKPDEIPSRGEAVDVDFSKAEVEQLRAMVKAYHSTMATVMLAFFNILLSKLVRHEDIVVGIPLLGREHSEFEKVVGMFVKALPIRLNPRAEMTFEEFLASVQSKFQGALDNQSYPYEHLARELNIFRETTRNPWYDVMFTYEHFQPDESTLPELTITPYTERRTTDIKNLILIVLENTNAFKAIFRYSPALFRPETIDKFLHYFKMIVLEIIQNPRLRLGDIAIIEEAEQDTIFNQFNRTEQALDRETTFLELFYERVRLHPGRTAVTHNGESLSFQELYDRSLRLSRYITEQGLKAQSHVAIYMPRSIEMLVSILATFHAGCAYVPLDIHHPKERVREILADSEAPLVLTTTESQATIQEIMAVVPGAKTLIDTRQPIPVHANGNGQPYNQLADMQDLVYLIYTSGTTGKPKGVMIHQLGMINHLYAKIRDLELTEADVIAQTASPCFDISVWQFLTGLITGGKTHIIDQDKLVYPESLVHELRMGEVSVFESVPSLMINLLQEFAYGIDYELPSLRWMVSTGEQLTLSTARKWYEYFPEVQLLNAYGPTEASDDITHQLILRPQKNEAIIAIGKPVQNMKIFILTEYMTLCPIGVRGEICVAGIGVGKGYWNNADKTAQTFVPNPFTERSGGADYATLYKTGDVGFYLPDGQIVYTGRKDNQVKIRGNRVETGEIENRLAVHIDVQEAAVVAQGSEANKYLIAYYVSAREINAAEFREYLANQLPDYMVPNFFQRIDKMPLTFNGKLDRSALPEPEIDMEALSVAYQAPANELETRLVKIWADILELDEGLIGTRTNYFTLGGHSLNAITLMGQVHRGLNVKVPLREFFLNPTVQHMARYIEANLWISKGDSTDDVSKIEVSI